MLHRFCRPSRAPNAGRGPPNSFSELLVRSWDTSPQSQDPCRILAGFLQDPCRTLAGFLQDPCRILAGSLPDPCGLLAGTRGQSWTEWEIPIVKIIVKINVFAFAKGRSWTELDRVGLQGSRKDPARILQEPCKGPARILQESCQDPARVGQRWTESDGVRDSQRHTEAD